MNQNRMKTVIGTFLQDVRYAARGLRKSAAFTAVAVFTFAIGIGANTAIFSMVNGLMLRPVLVDHPGQLTYLVQHREHWGNGFSYPDFEDIRNQSTGVFTDLAAYKPFQVDGLSVGGHSQTIWTAYVTSNFFSMMGIQPALGSFISPAEKVAGSDPVLVLGNSYWKSRFNSDPKIIGQQVSMNGRPVTIIGVAPEGFRGPLPVLETQGYLPMGVMGSIEDQKKDPLANRDESATLVFGRLRENTTPEQTQPALAVVAKRLADAYPATHKDLKLRSVSLKSGLISSDGSNPMPVIGLLFLFLAGFVLLLAAANVANLLLVRAVGRNREMAVRSALGAARARLIRQVLTETLLLALMGCAAGAALGMIGSRLLSHLQLQSDIPFVLDFHFDWRVFGYALAAALVVTLVAGVMPALRAARVDLNDVMRESSRGASGGRSRFRTTLVVAQVAGSLMLLIVAGLFMRSLQNAQKADLGFDPNHVVNFALDPHEAGYDEVRGREFYRDLLARVGTSPGVSSASFALTVPMGPVSLGGKIRIEGYQQTAGQPSPTANMNAVSPGYFKTMRIAVLRGREFRDTDSETAQRVALINEFMAQRYWPEKDPIGQSFTREEDKEHIYQVVGVVKNSRTGDLFGSFEPYYYIPIAQQYQSLQTLQVRGNADTATIIGSVRQLVRSMEPNMPVSEIRTMTQALDTPSGYMLFRLAAVLAGMLGLMGFVLAIVGVYGVISYSAAQRTREIGIRIALGAQSSQVLRVVLRQAFFIVGVGLAIGTGLSLAIGRVVRGFLMDVGGADPVTFLVVSGILAIVALSACLIPALRSTHVDPMVALRYE